MKKYLLTLLIFIILFGFKAMAQDVIMLKNGDEIKSLVQEIGADYVKYKKFDNQTGPLYNMAISEIFMIKYANGTKDVFNKVETTVEQPKQTYQEEVTQEKNCTMTSCGLLVSCSDYPKILTYDEALSQCPSGYRLPTIDELQCMAKNKTTLNLSKAGEYWSVTTTGNKAYTVTMDDGKKEKCGKDEKKRVRYIKDNHSESAANTNTSKSESKDNDKTLNQKPQAIDNQSNNNYALLHLYRPGMFYGSAVRFNIDLEDQEVWNCKSGRKITIKLIKEGPTTVHARTEADASVTFDAEFGKEYYIECTIGMGVWVGHPILTLKDESVGLSMFQKIKKDDTR